MWEHSTIRKIHLSVYTCEYILADGVKSVHSMLQDRILHTNVYVILVMYFLSELDTSYFKEFTTEHLSLEESVETSILIT